MERRKWSFFQEATSLKIPLHLLVENRAFVDVHRVDGTWWVPGGYLVGTWWVPGGYLVGTWWVPGGCWLEHASFLRSVRLMESVLVDASRPYVRKKVEQHALSACGFIQCSILKENNFGSRRVQMPWCDPKRQDLQDNLNIKPDKL